MAPSDWSLAFARITRAVVLLAALIASGSFAAESHDAAGFFDLNIGDLKVEIADAKKDGKKALMVMFEQDGCPACLHMKRNILSRKDVQDFYRANFTNLSLNIWSSVPVKDFADRERTEKAFAQSAKIAGTPTFVFYDLSGAEVVRIVGPIQTPDEFLLLGRFVASGAYKTRSFAQYKGDRPTKKGI